MHDAYWDLRDRLFADEHPGRRPISFWWFEAPGVCRHDPRCELPGERPGGGADWDARHRWLDEHDQLSVRERAALAERAALTPEPERLDVDADDA